MNVFTIFAGLVVLAIATFTGYLSVQLFIEGGMTPIFGGIALAVLTIMSLVLGVLFIGLGWAGVVAYIRSGK